MLNSEEVKIKKKKKRNQRNGYLIYIHFPLFMVGIFDLFMCKNGLFKIRTTIIKTSFLLFLSLFPIISQSSILLLFTLLLTSYNSIVYCLNKLPYSIVHWYYTILCQYMQPIMILSFLIFSLSSSYLPIYSIIYLWSYSLLP